MLSSGHWPDAPGQVVLDEASQDFGGLQVGKRLTITGLIERLPGDRIAAAGLGHGQAVPAGAHQDFQPLPGQRDHPQRHKS